MGARGKQNTKSGWKKKDKAFRDAQNAAAKANRERSEVHARLMAEQSKKKEEADASTGD